jgi:hypothetical protein
VRCSSCSETIRPVVAIDIDGVLGDYHAHFLRFAVPYFGFDLEKLLEMSLSRYDGSIPFSLYCEGHFGITLQEYRDCKLAYRQGGMKRSMPINEFAGALCRLVRQEAELWVTTTRPYLSLDGVVPDTRFWLALHRIDYDGLLFDADKYMTLAERVDPERVTAIVDDYDKAYDAAAEIYGPGIPLLYENGYNAAMTEGRQSRAGLRNVCDWIRESIRDWQTEYA